MLSGHNPQNFLHLHYVLLLLFPLMAAGGVGARKFLHDAIDKARNGGVRDGSPPLLLAWGTGRFRPRSQGDPTYYTWPNSVAELQTATAMIPAECARVGRRRPGSVAGEPPHHQRLSRPADGRVLRGARLRPVHQRARPIPIKRQAALTELPIERQADAVRRRPLPGLEPGRSLRGAPAGAFVLLRVMAVATSVHERLDRLFKQRIVIFDGSMGVMLQKRGLSDAEFRGERFRDHPKPLRNNSDILCLSQPEMVTKVHLDYLEAGADIITTNTFTATAVSQADYGLADLAYEMNVEGARLARKAADAYRGPLRRRLARPDQRHALALPEGRRPLLPRRHLRRAAARICRGRDAP